MKLISKKRYLQTFGICVIVLAIVRAAFPEVAGPPKHDTKKSAIDSLETVAVKEDTIVKDEALHATQVAVMATPETSLTEAPTTEAPEVPERYHGKLSTRLFFNADGSLVRHRIYSVPHFGNTFPDANDVQLASAKKLGVKPVADRHAAENMKKELVYIASNPFFHVDRLKSSIPYLVPEASVLLQDIGRNFFDSLQVKGIPLHKIIVTSVLRSKADIEKLRGHNANATENSCHLYGTTFDVCYNRYKTVQDPDGPARRQVRNDSLKWVLSEVLNDMRKNNRCWVKYEVKQGCFHITVRK
ncbi:MAG: DUF5715 family protein [Prevotella sp.]|nr:DUF5715 family protein [Prevotella sp.]